MTGDVHEAIAAIMHPLPDWESFKSQNEDLAKDDVNFAFADVNDRAERERATFLHDLREAASLAYETEQEFDPVLETIEECRAAIDAAEHRMRLLIAYGREFVRPQPYQLKDLARASGLSISGVRIAYDREEVDEVTQQTGVKPRRPWPDSES